MPIFDLSRVLAPQVPLVQQMREKIAKALEGVDQVASVQLVACNRSKKSSRIFLAAERFTNSC
jgi:hypothetical protein